MTQVASPVKHTQEQPFAPRTTYISPLNEEDAIKQARLLCAIADPIRLQILYALGKYEGTICVEELVAMFPLTQPTISHHLRILRDAGLVAVRKERKGSLQGRYSYYFLYHHMLNQTQEIITDLCRAGHVTNGADDQEG
jgi:ArsR family transcriptional regulator